MNRIELPVLHLARLVLEARTALSVTTGTTEGTFDTQLVRDANGLPALPATALAGVLRHLWIDAHGEASANALFGFQEKNQGAASRLTVSWGALLDSQGQPAEGLLLGDERKRLEDDNDGDALFKTVLQQADAPVVRDRVRLTHRGAAADQGKFDRSVLPAGHRFALELRLWSQTKDDADWRRLLGLLAHPLFRLGGATRAGLGAMELVVCHARSFDLKDPEDIRAFRNLSRGLADIDGLDDLTQKAKAWAADTHVLNGILKLTALNLWRIGQGETLLGPDKHGKVADLLPKVEEVIDWGAGRGERKLQMCLLPASSLKGALAHRIAFHYRRLAGDWAGGVTDEQALNARPPAVAALLGEVKDTEEEAGRRIEQGCVGALVIDDAWIAADTVQVARLMHNAIDRFTGGVRDRVLYEEESLFGGEIEVPITLDQRRLDKNCERLGISKEEQADVREALRLALDDLCQARLALGSRTTTGNGFFDGQLEGPLRDWLNENDDQEAAA